MLSAATREKSHYLRQFSLMTSVLIPGFSLEGETEIMKYKPKHPSQAICWSAGKVCYFTYKCESDWAIALEMVIGYEMPSALLACGCTW